MQYFYTRQRAAARPRPRGLVRPVVRRQPAVRRRARRLDHRPARRERRRAADDALLSTSASAAAVIAFEEVPRDEVRHYGIAKPKTRRRAVRDRRPRREAVAARGAEQPGDRRALRAVAGHLRRAGADQARQGRRDSADRRDPRGDPRRRPGLRRPSAARTSGATTSATSRPTSRRSSSSRWPIRRTGRALRRHLLKRARCSSS